MRSNTIIIWLHSLLAAAVVSQEVKDYCFPNIFNATCGHEAVIVMVSARYGRMRKANCLYASDKNIGCSMDILLVMDARCSGRRHCTMSFPDPQLHQIQPCDKDLLTYLEASYRCVEVITSAQCDFRPNGGITVSSSAGYLASIVADEQGLGALNCPWLLRVEPGQRINITLLDFGLATRDKQSLATCQIYAKIREVGLALEEPICGDATRERVVFASKGNSIDVRFTSLKRESQQTTYFLLRYEAIGCGDPLLPKNSWLERNKDKAKVSCNFTTQVWHIVCSANKWVGSIENCTTANVEVASHVVTSSASVPYGLLTAVFIGVVLGVLIGIAMLATVVACHRRARKHTTDAYGTTSPEAFYSQRHLQERRSRDDTYTEYDRRSGCYKTLIKGSGPGTPCGGTMACRPVPCLLQASAEYQYNCCNEGGLLLASSAATPMLSSTNQSPVIGEGAGGGGNAGSKRRIAVQICVDSTSSAQQLELGGQRLGTSCPYERPQFAHRSASMGGDYVTSGSCDSRRCCATTGELRVVGGASYNDQLPNVVQSATNGDKMADCVVGHAPYGVIDTEPNIG